MWVSADGANWAMDHRQSSTTTVSLAMIIDLGVVTYQAGREVERQRSAAEAARALATAERRRAGEAGRQAPIGIGGSLAAPPLPHHRAYGSVPRRFDRVKRLAMCQSPGFRVPASP